MIPPRTQCPIRKLRNAEWEKIEQRADLPDLPDYHLGLGGLGLRLGRRPLLPNFLILGGALLGPQFPQLW